MEIPIKWTCMFLFVKRGKKRKNLCWNTGTERALNPVSFLLGHSASNDIKAALLSVTKSQIINTVEHVQDKKNNMH